MMPSSFLFYLCVSDGIPAASCKIPLPFRLFEPKQGEFGGSSTVALAWGRAYERGYINRGNLRYVTMNVSARLSAELWDLSIHSDACRPNQLSSNSGLHGCRWTAPP